MAQSLLILNMGIWKTSPQTVIYESITLFTSLRWVVIANAVTKKIPALSV